MFVNNAGTKKSCHVDCGFLPCRFAQGFGMTQVAPMLRCRGVWFSIHGILFCLLDSLGVAGSNPELGESPGF